jgi:ankyrin repeat protein
VVCRYVEIIKILLNGGASPFEQDSIGRTCLHVAALSSAASCITAVLNADRLGRAFKDMRVGDVPFVDMVSQRVSLGT